MIGGYFSGSLAIISDAAEKFGDVLGYMLSLISIFIASKKANLNYSFGYHRAEIIGTFINVFIL